MNGWCHLHICTRNGCHTRHAPANAVRPLSVDTHQLCTSTKVCACQGFCRITKTVHAVRKKNVLEELTIALPVPMPWCNQHCTCLCNNPLGTSNANTTRNSAKKKKMASHFQNMQVIMFACAITCTLHAFRGNCLHVQVQKAFHSKPAIAIACTAMCLLV